MTNPDPGTARATPSRALTPMAALLLVGMTVAGCGDPPPPPPPPPPPAPPAPPNPADALRDLDPGVQFPEHRLPSSLEVADAIVDFANAFKGGDRDEVLSQLTPSTRNDLVAMLSQREWQSVIDTIEAVRVCIVEDLGSSEVRVGLGIQEPDGAYLLGWEATRRGDVWMWEAVAVGDPRAPRVSQLDAPALPSPRADQPDAGVSTTGGAPQDDDADGRANPSGTTTTVPTGRPG